MNASNGAAVAMATSASGYLRASHMRPRPFPSTALRSRALDGSYPFREHRTCAELGL